MYKHDYTMDGWHRDSGQNKLADMHMIGKSSRWGDSTDRIQGMLHWYSTYNTASVTRIWYI